jgi:type IV secretory pathway VirB10-like protein
MRAGRRVHPEWGHVAPASSLRRILGATAVAIAVGATGSAAVVLSMVGNQDGAADRAVTAARASISAEEAAPAAPAKPPAASPAAAPPQDTASARPEPPEPPPAAPPAPAEKLADADVSAAPAAPVDDAHGAGAHGRNAGVHRRFVPWGPPAFRRFAHSFFASFQSHRRTW